MLQLEYFTTRALESTDEATVAFYTDAVSDRAAALRRLSGALLYGSNGFNVAGSLRESADMRKLMLDDGCSQGGGGFHLPEPQLDSVHAPIAAENASHFAMAGTRSLGILMQADTGYSYGQCFEYKDGILSNGLLGALQQIGDSAVELVQAHAASRGQSSSGFNASVDEGAASIATERRNALLANLATASV